MEPADSSHTLSKRPRRGRTGARKDVLDDVEVFLCHKPFVLLSYFYYHSPVHRLSPNITFLPAKLRKKNESGLVQFGSISFSIKKKRVWFVPHPLFSSLKSQIIGMDYHLIAIFFWFTIYTPDGRDSMLSVSPAAIFTVLMSMPFVEKMFTHLVMSLWI